MPTSNKKNEMQNQAAFRRKRVNQLKSIIILAAVLLLFASVILNIVLLFRVLKLEEQLDKLYTLNQVTITQDILYS